MASVTVPAAPPPNEASEPDTQAASLVPLNQFVWVMFQVPVPPPPVPPVAVGSQYKVAACAAGPPMPAETTNRRQARRTEWHSVLHVPREKDTAQPAIGNRMAYLR